MSLIGGNRNDVTQLIRAVPAVRGQSVGIAPIIARRGPGHGSGLGKYCWVAEQTFALLHWFRRLRIRWEIRDDIHEAFSAWRAPSSASADWPTHNFVRSC